MKGVHMISFILVIIGGLNWGLVGLSGFIGADLNVVHMILGSWMVLENIVYILVGLSALSLVFTHKRDCRMCSAGSMPSM